MSQSSKKSKAVALKYQADTDVAPVVIASGCGNIAEKIIDIAENKGIPVFRDDSAASLMCMLEVGRPIPPELYQVVAVIYSHLLKISKDIKHYTDDTPMPRTRVSPARTRRLSNK
ncbi:MAG: EscU/YscU/HrcU family type III secretion system export apparatus switch protein [Oscillospiraceae bacterium]|nr:EscU/YscU/HrcU family type III secretion system export apparatus switch protein [Oscillospiraceae bacterium]MBP1578066.1 EscU/YscU/HrcU family type III secretion system export apparatus switch protein [Oscillospiraceae bacterium]